MKKYIKDTERLQLIALTSMKNRFWERIEEINEEIEEIVDDSSSLFNDVDGDLTVDKVIKMKNIVVVGKLKHDGRYMAEHRGKYGVVSGKTLVRKAFESKEEAEEWAKENYKSDNWGAIQF